MAYLYLFLLFDKFDVYVAAKSSGPWLVLDFRTGEGIFLDLPDDLPIRVCLSLSLEVALVVYLWCFYCLGWLSLVISGSICNMQSSVLVAEG